MENKTNQNYQQNEKLRSLYVIMIIIIIVFLLYLIGISIFFDKWQTSGVFGDSFGAINALFSGLAFAGIIYTILLQRKELALQRLELIETRIELKRAADAQEKSEKALVEQTRSMKLTAKLNALNALIEYYKPNISPYATDKKVMFVKEIEKTLVQLADDTSA